jgi:hypothetical protein
MKGPVRAHYTNFELKFSSKEVDPTTTADLKASSGAAQANIVINNILDFRTRFRTNNRVFEDEKRIMTRN